MKWGTPPGGDPYGLDDMLGVPVCNAAGTLIQDIDIVAPILSGAVMFG
jgi:hypothetical protein